jgi:hypothetical protein
MGNNLFVFGVLNFSAMLQNVCFYKLNIICVKLYIQKMYMSYVFFCICICLCFSLKINTLQKKIIFGINTSTYQSLVCVKNLQKVSLKPVSEWLYIMYIMARTFCTFNEVMMMSTLFQTSMLSWIYIVLAKWYNSPQSTTTHSSDTEPTSLCSYYLLLCA